MSPRPPSERLDAFRLRVPRHGTMRVDGVVYASTATARRGLDDESLRQVANVASLPGIVGASLAMPDVHQGYGFPIGGVAAFDPDAGGVVSPGGVGYDINCGVRLYASDLPERELAGRLDAVVEALFRAVPTGVGSSQRGGGLGERDLDRVLRDGARWAVAQGHGDRADLEAIEEGGCLPADPAALGARARERGRPQLGTLGSGNHFVELGRVAEVLDPALAQAFGLAPGTVTVMIHTGSRGLGHQVCDDFLRTMAQAAARHHLVLPDRQLACAPVTSAEGQAYLGAMGAAANFAFANRQVIGAAAGEALEQALGMAPAELRLRLVYDVCHNIAKLEDHVVEGRRRRLCVHRKGATRALPPGDPRLGAAFRDTGQPVLVPGDMGRGSFVLAGRPGAAATFLSACHGAGRVLSRQAALREARGRVIPQELAARGVHVRAADRRTLVEEMPDAYRDVTDVVAVVEGAGLARAVARLEPLAVIKG